MPAARGVGRHEGGQWTRTSGASCPRTNSWHGFARGPRARGDVPSAASACLSTTRGRTAGNTRSDGRGGGLPPSPGSRSGQVLLGSSTDRRLGAGRPRRPFPEERERVDARRDQSTDHWPHHVDPEAGPVPADQGRSEEHTSELQSRENLVCRLLREKRKEKRLHHLPAGIKRERQKG